MVGEKGGLEDPLATEPGSQPSSGYQYRILLPTKLVGGPSGAEATMERPEGGWGRGGGSDGAARRAAGGCGTIMPRAASKSSTASLQWVRCVL